MSAAAATAASASKKRRITADEPAAMSSATENVIVEETASAAVAPNVTEQFDAMIATIASLGAAVKTLQAQLKQAQKDVVKMAKEAAKKASKSGRKGGAKKDENGVAKPSGFDKPTLLSDALCAFLGQAAGTRLGRTDVTRMVNAYIKDNNLQDPEDKRKILPDDKLRSVLSVSDSDVLTFFNIQRFIKHNFVKEEAQQA